MKRSLKLVVIPLWLSLLWYLTSWIFESFCFCQVVLTPIVVWHASFFLLSQTLFIVSLCNNQLLYLIEKELIWIFDHIPRFPATLPSVIAKLHAAKDKYLSPPAPVSPYSQMEVSTISLNMWPFDFELEWPVLRALNYSSHFLSPCLVWTQIPKKCYSSYHIEYLRYVHGALNVDEKKLITQFGWKSRDERFEPN